MNEQLLANFAENLDIRNYTDEELLEHINLDEPYTEEELMEKLTVITDMFGSSSSATAEDFLQFYKNNK